MPYSTLEMLAERVRDDLERHCENRPARLDQRLEQLVYALLTAEAPPELAELAESGQIHGFSTHLSALERHLRENARLPEALCARYKYKASLKRARSLYKVSNRAWDYFHDLAAELDWDPALYVPLIAYEKCAWHDRLEERFVDVEVILDAQALEGMLISALEGYLSPRKSRRKGSEIYGINLGMIRDVPHKRLQNGTALTRYISVMRSQPQLSAEVEYGAAVPNARSLEAILETMATLYPQYQAIGDFHSHPYDEVSALEAARGWRYSGGDEASNMALAESLTELGQHLSVAFIIGIARAAQPVRSSHYKGLKNTFQLTLGNCRVILAAYRSLGGGRLTQSNIRLRLSGTVG